MITRASLFEELSKYSSSGLLTRAENSLRVGVQFLALLRSEIPDDRDFDLIMKAWMRAVKDDDFSKFKRVYAKYGPNRKD